MSQTCIYACVPRSAEVRKESLIYENIESAIETLAGMDKHFVATPAKAVAPGNLPGLREIRSSESIVALGRAAHTVLADFQKRTLIASGSETIAGEELSEDIGRFVWACVNTAKVVALGAEAWRAVQIMPLTERRFYEIPPLRMASRSGASGAGTVLVVDHERDPSHARRLADLLAAQGFEVETTARRDLAGGAGRDDVCWAGAASFHVHVGHHALSAEEMRLVDSWHSRRFAIQWLPRHVPRDMPPADALMIEHEANGFVVDTPERVIAACREIGADRILQKKLLDAGSRTVEPLARAWSAIARELVA